MQVQEGMKISFFHRYFSVFIVYILILQSHKVQSQLYTGILAGGNGCGWSGDGGPATSAKVNDPYGVWSDSMGNVYFSESTGIRVRVVNSAGIINTIVGTGGSNTSGAGGPGISTSLDAAFSLVGDNGSSLYIAGHYFTWQYSFSTLWSCYFCYCEASFWSRYFYFRNSLRC